MYLCVCMRIYMCVRTAIRTLQQKQGHLSKMLFWKKRKKMVHLCYLAWSISYNRNRFALKDIQASVQLWHALFQVEKGCSETTQPSSSGLASATLQPWPGGHGRASSEKEIWAWGGHGSGAEKENLNPDLEQGSRAPSAPSCARSGAGRAGP